MNEAQLTQLIGALGTLAVALVALWRAFTHTHDAIASGAVANPAAPVAAVSPSLSVDLGALIVDRSQALAAMGAAFTASIAVLEAAGDTTHAAQLRTVQSTVLQVAEELSNSSAAQGIAGTPIGGTK